MTGYRPVSLTTAPATGAASALNTPKQIITKPMLLMPYAQPTNAWIIDQLILRILKQLICLLKKKKVNFVCGSLGAGYLIHDHLLDNVYCNVIYTYSQQQKWMSG